MSSAQGKQLIILPSNW